MIGSCFIVAPQGLQIGVVHHREPLLERIVCCHVYMPRDMPAQLSCSHFVSLGASPPELRSCDRLALHWLKKSQTVPILQCLHPVLRGANQRLSLSVRTCIDKVRRQLQPLAVVLTAGVALDTAEDVRAH
jgi:hypothetical protein